MTTATVIGAQEPRVCSVPDYVASTGGEAVELAATAGLVLDPWEVFVLERALGERADGSWAAFEVGLVVSRQNGKGAVLEARELAGLFLLGEGLIIHSAHQFDTSIEAFLRMEALLEGSADLSRRVKRVSRSHGSEGFVLRSGQRLRYRTRTKGGGRGFTGDCLVLDEAMDLPESFHGALLPTLSARSVVGNPQVWYTGSAVDQAVHPDGVVLARVRERGLAGDDPSLAYFEWSVDSSLADLRREQAVDEALWAEANPGLGIRISADHVAKEQRSLDARRFAVERLGVGDWPRTDYGVDPVLDMVKWAAALDARSQVSGPVCFAFDVNPARDRAAVAVAGRRPDGRVHVEVVQHQSGTGWLVDRVADLLEAHESVGLVCDPKGPAGSFVGELETLGVKVRPVGFGEYAQACGQLVDKLAQNRLRHLGQPPLEAAVRGATSRPLGDAWAWSRRGSSVDISPLVAGTLAVWGSEALKKPRHRSAGFS